MAKINKKELKTIVTEVFNDSVEEELKDNIELKIVNSMFKSVGALFFGKDINFAKMRINLYQLKKGQPTKEEIKYQTYQTVLHEKEHAKTFFYTKKDDFYSYEHLITTMEYLYYANMFKIDINCVALNFYNTYALNKQLSKNYELSSGEIFANLVSYTELQRMFKEEFPDEKNDTCNNIISSLKFLNEHMEVFYNQGGVPLNRFMFFLVNSTKYIKEHPETINKYQILGHLFNKDGSVKSLYEIYTNINDDNELMYKRIMISYLTTVDCDYTESFKDRSFKEYVEALISDYITGTIDYYKNMDRGKLFVTKESILTDNLIMKKKNVKTLNEISRKYGLTLTSGTIVDSKTMYCNKLTP